LPCEIELLLHLLAHGHAVGGAHCARRVSARRTHLPSLALLLRVLLKQ